MFLREILNRYVFKWSFHLLVTDVPIFDMQVVFGERCNIFLS